MMLQIYTCKCLKQQGECRICALRAIVINEVPTVNIEYNLLPVPHDPGMVILHAAAWDLMYYSWLWSTPIAIACTLN